MAELEWSKKRGQLFTLVLVLCVMCFCLLFAMPLVLRGDFKGGFSLSPYIHFCLRFHVHVKMDLMRP